MASDQSEGDSPHSKVCPLTFQPAVFAGPALSQEELQGDNCVTCVVDWLTRCPEPGSFCIGAMHQAASGSS